MDDATRRFVLSWIPTYAAGVILIILAHIVDFQIRRDDRRRASQADPKEPTS